MWRLQNTFLTSGLFIILFASTALSQFPAGPDRIGVYFDQDGALASTIELDEVAPLYAHFIISNPTSSQVEGFEFLIDPEGMIILSSVPPGRSVNMGSNLEQLVGLCEPLRVASSEVAIIRQQWLYNFLDAPALIFIRPAGISRDIPLYVGEFPEVVRLVPASGCYDIPVAAINLHTLPSCTTIDDVQQYDAAGDPASPHSGLDVTVDGRTYVTHGTYGDETRYLQDNSGGIAFLAADVDTLPYGTRVRVTGTVSSRYGEIVIDPVSEVTPLIWGMPHEATDVPVAELGLDTERVGSLVECTCEVVAVAKGELLVADGADTLSVIIYPDTGIDTSSLMAGDVYSMRGACMMKEREITLAPRSASDLEHSPHGWPQCVAWPDTLAFDSLAVGEHQYLSFQVTNAGGAALCGEIAETCDHFSIHSGSGPFALGHGDTLDVVVMYEPTEIGNYECVIDTGAEGCLDIVCTGAVLIPPSCAIGPVELDFGLVAVGGYADLMFEISNTGGSILEGIVSDTSDSFYIRSGSGPFMLGAGEYQSVEVRFTPSVSGEHVGYIDLGTGLCDQVDCRGFAVSPYADGTLLADGEDDQIYVPNSPSLEFGGDTTIDLVLRPLDDLGWSGGDNDPFGVILAKVGGTGWPVDSSWRLDIDSLGYLTFTIYGTLADLSVTSDTALLSDRYSRVKIVFDQGLIISDCALFIDDVLHGSDDLVGGILHATNAPVWIGGITDEIDSQVVDRYTNGLVDEVRIWQGVEPNLSLRRTSL